MYFTANGRALPCCIAPFSQRGYENYTLGDATQQSLARNLERSGLFIVPRGAIVGSAAHGLRQLRPALESVSVNVAVAIPTLNEQESIGDVVRSIPRDVVDQIIVADGGSGDRTREEALAAGADVIDAGRGYGRACLMATVNAVDADIMVFMDGDGADDPASIAALVAPIQSGATTS